MAKLKVGVLALQGAFAKHVEMLGKLGVQAVEVRVPRDLKGCAGVIIPGGESTTILKQLWYIELFQALADFAEQRPLFGTCAGLILMSKEIVADQSIKPFGLLDVIVERNAFGRQVESFSATVDVTLGNGKPRKIPALFIRAPRIKLCGPDVKVLAKYENEPIFVQQGQHLGATFHPELTSSTLIHEYFIRHLSR
jgi:5'-phosphate synthase pdxT subunit